ncbi:hypothetical protein [Bradyrhizobium sp. CCGB20]|uniref:hypothetical protein n=1 Tax=Bradyrhizobium sp. CCGB20 TaxID=2949633 RepID=UPI0020B1CFBE|nr:hypothetical protein [Bradyrhizobium sp. CCGB20]MCP3400494.1 hypothetical protein [Bradyrhizobium sp. CCGB20]
MTYRRLRSAISTRVAIEAIQPDAREQRALHLVARERGQRLAAAQDEVAAAQKVHAEAVALVPEAEAALAAAKARLAEIEAEIEAEIGAATLAA